MRTSMPRGPPLARSNPGRLCDPAITPIPPSGLRYRPLGSVDTLGSRVVMGTGESDWEFAAPSAEEAATTAQTAIMSQAAVAANMVVRCTEVSNQKAVLPGPVM